MFFPHKITHTEKGVDQGRNNSLFMLTCNFHILNSAPHAFSKSSLFMGKLGIAFIANSDIFSVSFQLEPNSA